MFKVKILYYTNKIINPNLILGVSEVGQNNKRQIFRNFHRGLPCSPSCKYYLEKLTLHCHPFTGAVLTCKCMPLSLQKYDISYLSPGSQLNCCLEKEESACLLMQGDNCL